MSNVRVCVDVVGGDEKPQVVLDGIEAALAADPDIEVLAAGPAEIVNPFAASHARVEALEAPDVIAMDDDPIRAVMTKRKSSIVLACRAIKKGNADAFFSAGSTGAMTAAATAYVTPFRYHGRRQEAAGASLSDQCAAQSRRRSDGAVRYGRQPRCRGR